MDVDRQGIRILMILLSFVIVVGVLGSLILKPVEGPPWSTHDWSLPITIKDVSPERFVLRYGGHLYVGVHAHECGEDVHSLEDRQSAEPFMLIRDDSEGERTKVRAFFYAGHLFEAHHMAHCDHVWCVDNR